MTETTFERCNRLGAASKASHDARMAGLVRLNAQRRPDAYRHVGVEARARCDWWAETDLWIGPGYSASEVEHETFWSLFWQTWSKEVSRLRALEPKPVRVVRPWKPLAEIHLEQLLSLMTLVIAGQLIPLLQPKDLTEPEVAL